MRVRKRSVTLLAGCIFGLCILCSAQQEQRCGRSARVVPLQEVEVVSPDGKVRFSLLSNAERLTFLVTMGRVSVIEPSPIVMKVDGFDLSSGVVFKNLERYEIDERYPFRGARGIAVNRCSGARVFLQHDLSEWDYVLEVRVFDDGIAFRHIVAGGDSARREPDDYTTFVIPAGSIVWSHDMDGHYEAEYRRQEISEITSGQWAGPPVTVELPASGGYASITEANLVNYSGMALEADGRRGLTVGLGHRQPLNYPFELRYGREEAKRLAKPAAIAGTITTPWRVVIAGRDLNTLVNSMVVANLCPPPDPALFPDGNKTPWLKPGRAVWRYVDGGDGSFEGLKAFSRMAGQLGFEHHVIEGVWNRWTPGQRREMAEYSGGVGVWFWKHRKELRTEKEQDEFFGMLEDLGVVGAKIDFFDHEAKEVVDLYEDLLRKAAEHRIMLVFHGANKPTGRDRTWPNEMVREAIRGMESRRLMERARHQTILPFTRYLAGPADYTTMLFSERRRDTNCPIRSQAWPSSPVRS